MKVVLQYNAENMQKRWPLHPVSRPQESLLQWVKRLAAVYEVSLKSFCKHALRIPSNQLYLLTDVLPTYALEELEAGMGIPTEQLRRMAKLSLGKR